MINKYKLSHKKENGLYRIIALKGFGTLTDRRVGPGDVGGLVSAEHNLSQDGSCWIYPGGKVTDHARVSHQAEIWGHVAENARVENKVFIGREVEISGEARVHGDSDIEGRVHVYGSVSIGPFFKIDADDGIIYIEGTSNTIEIKAGNPEEGC